MCPNSLPAVLLALRQDSMILFSEEETMSRLPYLLAALILVLTSAAFATDGSESAAPPTYDPAFTAFLAASSTGPATGGEKGDDNEPGVNGFCSITISCYDGSTRSCSDTDSVPTCDGQDQNCYSNTGGFVNCDGGPVDARCSRCPLTCSIYDNCFSDSDCGWGYCDKEPWEIVGGCVCD